MTTIFWHQDHLYSDSNMVDGSETFASLSKIRALPKPIPYVSKKHKIKDVVYGYVVTGALRPAEAMVSMLEHFGEPDTLETVYGLVSKLRVVNFDNHFEAIFIGGKANYSFTLIDNDDESVFRLKPHKQNFCIGSGTAHLKDIVSQFPGPDPIRLMYAIYCRDTASSGMIDVWKLTKNGKDTTFGRVGICRGMDGRNPAALIDDMYAPYPYDWILNPKAPKPPRKKLAQPTPSPRTDELMPTLK